MADQKQEEKTDVKITRRRQMTQRLRDGTTRDFVRTSFTFPGGFGSITIPSDEWSEEAEVEKIADDMKMRKEESVDKTVKV